MECCINLRTTHSLFCLLITAKMVDSMLIGAKTVSDSFERKLRKRRIAYTIAAFSPFIIWLVFGVFLGYRAMVEIEIRMREAGYSDFNITDSNI